MKSTTVKTTTTRKTVVTYSADDLRLALVLPKDARIYVDVPGGGDWSNTELAIENGGRCPLVVEYTETVETES